MTGVVIAIDINGTVVETDIEARTLLVQFIRDAGLTGTNVGCDTTTCGACTVLVDGVPVKSCTMFAVQAAGSAVTTIESLARDANSLTPLQQAFVDAHGVQCGFCTPGMILVASALLDENPDPTDREVREAISGNLCRCTGYVNIVKAIRLAAGLRNADTGS